MRLRFAIGLLPAIACLATALAPSNAQAQADSYASKQRAVNVGPSYDTPDPPPRLLVPPGGLQNDAEDARDSGDGGYQYSRNDYSRGEYSRNDDPRGDYARGDDSHRVSPRNDYSRNDYVPNDEPRNDYARREYSRGPSSRGDLARNDYRRGDSPRNYSRGYARNESRGGFLRSDANVESPRSGEVRRPWHRQASSPPAGDRIARTNAETIPAGQTLDPFGDNETLPPPAGTPDSYEYASDGSYQTGDISGDPNLQGGPFLQEPGTGGCEDCGGCGDCDSCCGGGGRCPFFPHTHDYFHSRHRSGAFYENIDLYMGKQAFKGPVDQGVNGDFGFHLGANWATPLVDSIGLGAQVGGAILWSDFEGSSGPLGSSRTQVFLTAGLFHRAKCNGFQGGVAYDYLRDNFYIDMNLMQLRAELSYIYCHHEIGFWGAFHLNSDTQQSSFSPTPGVRNVTYSFQGVDQFNAFYRYNFCNGAVCRSWAGLTSTTDVIFGADATVPVTQRCGLAVAYNYLWPTSDASQNRNTVESWNLTISFVWYPGYKSPRSWQNPYRPLFPVAENGWFMVRSAK